MKVKEKIGVLGCGWLGMSLAEELLQSGYQVKGTTTTETKIQELREAGIRAYKLMVEPEGIIGEVTDFLKGVEVLIINIPPGRKIQSAKDFQDSIGRLLNAVRGSTIRDVVFVSSISVYEDTEDFRSYSEQDLPNSTILRGQSLRKAEELFQNSDLCTTVLRFGGLVGGERHPVFYLAGRRGIANPEAPINLIHREDCIGIIKRIIEEKVFGEVFNVVYPVHPTKEDYYVRKSLEMDLQPPRFSQERSKGKVINSNKISSELKYRFKIFP